MFKTKCSKINWLQKTIEYKKNRIESEIFELKYGNRELSNVWKYNQVWLVLAVFISVFFVII